MSDPTSESQVEQNSSVGSPTGAEAPTADTDPIAQFLSEIWARPTIPRVKQAAVEVDPVEMSSEDPAASDIGGADTAGGTAESSGDSLMDRLRTGLRRLRIRPLFALIGVLVVVAGALVWFGASTILGSSDGRLVKRISDTSAPGFEAIVEKTPTDLLLAVGDDGSLVSSTLLALTSEDVGGVMSIPVETDVYISPSPGLVAPIALRDLVATSGIEAGSTKIGELLNLTFTDVTVLRPADLTSRLGRGVLTVSNPSDVVDIDGKVAFPKGSIALSPEQLWPYLSAITPDESPSVHAARSEAFWKAWVTQLGSSTDSGAGGIDRFLSSLSSSDVTYLPLPVTELPSVDGAPPRVRLAEGVTGPSAIAPIVPLPEGAPGRRPRLRVLDGTGELDDARGAAILLAAGGGQVDVIGNSTAFGVQVTQFVYYDPAQREAADRMRSVLGVGEVVLSTQTNSALDITVTLGVDYLDRSRSSSTGRTGG